MVPPLRRLAAGLAMAAALAALSACRAGGAGAGRPAGPGPAEGAHHPRVGTYAPDFAAQDPSGPWLSLRSFKDKPIALLLFRPGAASSEDLARALGRLREERTHVPIVFLGLARDSIARIEEFKTRHVVTLPLLRDPGTIARAYGVGDLPAVVLIDASGTIRFQLDGYLGVEYRPRLDATLAALGLLRIAPPAPRESPAADGAADDPGAAPRGGAPAGGPR